jgi:Na+-driven multidrug efflux pump
VFRLETMALFVAMGWGSAAQTFVGQNLGAGRADRATKSGWFAVLYDAVFMLLIAIAYQLAATPIIRFFDDDPEVVSMAVRYVAVVAWSYIGLGTGIVFGSAITGSGATRTTLLVDLGVVVVFQIPACVLAVALRGASLDRLWTMVALTYAVSGAAYLLVFRFARWIDRGTASAVPPDTSPT